jgi:hypothetical protein
LDASGGQAGGGDADSDEAVWRDLIARYDVAVDTDTDTAAPPWPDIENLGTRQLGQAARDQSRHDQARHDQPQHDQPQHDQAQYDQLPLDQAPRDTGSGPSSPASVGYTVGQPAGAQPGAAADPAGSEPRPREPETGPHEPEAGSSSGSADGPASDTKGGSAAGSGPDRTRVIRHATAPAPRLPAEQDDQDEVEHYVPPPPPPLPHLDPVAKGAWTALFGGPAYLLVASIAGWVVPGWAALGSVAAFIGGFTVLVLRLGDGPASDDGPDNGAVL